MCVSDLQFSLLLFFSLNNIIIIIAFILMLPSCHSYTELHHIQDEKKFVYKLSVVCFHW